MEKVNNKTVLYIVSDVRSGSTLLENILSKSTQIVSVGELHHLDSHLHKGKWGSSWNWKCSCGESFDLCKFWTKVFEHMNNFDFDDIKNTEVQCEKKSTRDEKLKQEAALNQVYNTAVGNRTKLVGFDKEIASVEVKYGSNRKGDNPHSLASVDKAKELLNYQPSHQIEKGIQEAVSWYWLNFKIQNRPPNNVE